MPPTTTAVPVPDGVDAGAVWHYGDPLGEQRVLTTGAGLVDRSNRDVVQVDGPDRLSWLHSICSQHVADLHDGDSTQALVLSPNGHVEQHWQLTEIGDRVWIDTEPAAAADALAFLLKMRFLKRVEPLDVTTDWAVLTVRGPRSADVLRRAGLPTPEPGHAIATADGGFVRATDQFDVLVPRTVVATRSAELTAAGAVPVGRWAYDALRVESRQARIGLETDHRTIPHEVGWIGTAVHLDKGCYRGQETVARVQNLGRPPRRLVLLHLSGAGDELPQPGTPVELGARRVGFVGTAVQHHELGPIALAVIKRQLPDDAQLIVAGQPVAVAD